MHSSLGGEQSETEQRITVKHNTNISVAGAFEQEAASFFLTEIWCYYNLSIYSWIDEFKRKRLGSVC